jgi:hypothetical protein
MVAPGGATRRQFRGMATPQLKAIRSQVNFNRNS